MSTIELACCPRDGLFLKDGRGWHTSASGRGHTLGWPSPATIRGALRTAWGRRLEELPGQTASLTAGEWEAQTQGVLLGAFLPLRRTHGVPWQIAHRMWPVPTDALYLEDKSAVWPLAPKPPRAESLGRDDDEAREQLWHPWVDDPAKPLPAPRWWREQDFAAWLTGDQVVHRHQGAELRQLAMARRSSTHVGIDRRRLSAKDGVLFSYDVLEPLAGRPGHASSPWEWAIGLRAELPQPAWAGSPPVLTLGGDRRLAVTEVLPSGLFEPPAPVQQSWAKGWSGLRLIIVTPALFSEQGWLPDQLEVHGREYRGVLPGCSDELVLRAAFVGRPLLLSGWDMHHHAPKPTRQLVAPGSVYFFTKANQAPFTPAELAGFWLAALGTSQDEGMGRVVPGHWQPQDGMAGPDHVQGGCSC